MQCAIRSPHPPLTLFAFVGLNDLDTPVFGICNPVQQGKGAAFRVAESPHLCPALIVNAVNPAVVLLLGGHKDDYKKEPLHCALSPLLQFRVWFLGRLEKARRSRI